jgi:polyhydroxyalkanoate synthesis regulator phasin
MRRARIAVFAVLAVALGIAGAGAALAASGAFSPDKTGQAVIDDAAQQLGIEPDELSAALKQALENRIDKAVDAGRLTQEQADMLKERLDSAEVPLLLPGFGLPFGGKHFGWFGHFAALDAAASYLGLTEEQLHTRLADGKSLADIAKAEGKSVDGLVQALVKSAGDRIDEAVENGKLTENQASDLKADLTDRITELVNREPGNAPKLEDGFGFRHRFGDGFRRDFHWFGGNRPDFSGPHI